MHFKFFPSFRGYFRSQNDFILCPISSLPFPLRDDSSGELSLSRSNSESKLKRLEQLEKEKYHWDQVLEKLGQEYDAQLEMQRQLHRSVPCTYFALLPNIFRSFKTHGRLKRLIFNGGCNSEWARKRVGWYRRIK